MDRDEPSAEDINKVVEKVGECDSINGRVDGDGEEKDVGHVADPECHCQ